MKTDTIYSIPVNSLRPEVSPARSLAVSAPAVQQSGAAEALQAARELRSARQEAAAAANTLPAEQDLADDETLQNAVTSMNDYVQNLQRDLRFEIDADLGRTVISVVDSDTQEVIRQIPPETVLERARRLQEEDMAEGFLLTERV